MLYTNLKHIESAADHNKVISENENVMVICGRMGPMCIPVYGIAEELEDEYKHVKFYDMEFDNPESSVIRNFLKFVDLWEFLLLFITKMVKWLKLHQAFRPKIR